MCVKEKGLGMNAGEGLREQLLEDERRVFIDSELPEFQNRAQRLRFIFRDFLQEVS